MYQMEIESQGQALPYGRLERLRFIDVQSIFVTPGQAKLLHRSTIRAAIVVIFIVLRLAIRPCCTKPSEDIVRFIERVRSLNVA